MSFYDNTPFPENKFSLFRDKDVYNESTLLSHKDFEYRLNEWKRGGKNILFVAGLSGSGKSTLASKLAKENNAIHVEIDLFENNSILYENEKNNDEGNKILKDWFDKNYGGAHKWEISKNAMEFCHALDKFMNYFVQYANKNKDKLYVVEGIQLMDSEYTDNKKRKLVYIDILEKYPCIITGASALKSMYRAYRREVDNGASFTEYMKSFNSFKAIKEYIDLYHSMDRNKNQVIKELKNKIGK